jgi:hypothetical protein
MVEHEVLALARPGRAPWASLPWVSERHLEDTIAVLASWEFCERPCEMWAWHIEHCLQVAALVINSWIPVGVMEMIKGRAVGQCWKYGGQHETLFYCLNWKGAFALPGTARVQGSRAARPTHQLHLSHISMEEDVGFRCDSTCLGVGN